MSDDNQAAPAPARPKPPTPVKLGARGRKLWAILTGKYAFEVWELPIVEAACRQADDIALLEEHLRENGLTTTGSTGQTRLSAAVTEVRLARRAFARMLGELRIPDELAEGEPVGMTFNQRRGQAAARQRWRNDARWREKHLGGET